MNVLLPDAIFEYRPTGERQNMVREFTYSKGINLLRQSIEFTKLAAGGVAVALSLLRASSAPVYTWQKEA